jgi:hypothetical protein
LYRSSIPGRIPVVPEQPIDLDAIHVVSSAEKLRNRVAERFPKATLLRTAERLVLTAKSTIARAEELARPNVPLRVAILLLIATLVLALGWGVYTLKPRGPGVERLDDAVAFFQSTVESLFFVGVGVAFLVTLEGRWKRRRALAAIHDLRVLSHLVDMHTLDKDPIYVTQKGRTTASSPKRTLTAFELNRYLDYCSEMLSLTGKIAAIYGRDLQDPVALGAIDQVESVTTDLSRKIWQKLMLLDRDVR